METAVSVLGAVETLEDGLVLVELPLLDRDVDADDVLPDDAPGTDVQVADRIASVAHTITPPSRRVQHRTHPTSEFPMSPSLRPTASPWTTRCAIML